MSDINSLFAAPPATVAVDTDVSIDFETRSAMDLKACGAHRYSRHPSTDALVAVFRFSKHDSIRWYPGEPLPARVRAAIEDESVLWHAHNAAFEIVIWQHVMVERYGMPALPIDRWSCTMVRCLMAGLPAQLDKAAPAAGLPEEFWKDDTGSRVMKQVSKPRKRHELGEQPASWAKLDGFNYALHRWTCLDSGSPWAAVVSPCREFTIYRDPDDGKSYVAQWWADEGRMQTLYDYCDQDTLAEWAIGERVPPLDETELAGWHMDQRINWRGYRIDTDFVRIALGASDRALEFANEEAREISNGYVSALTKPTEIRDWMNARLSDIGWSPIDGIGKEVLIVLRAQLQQELDTGALWGADIIGTLIRMIDLRTYEAKTSTRKLTAMLNAADTDDHRIRGGLQYAGAGRTARWAGRLVQPHNFPRPEKWATTEAQVESLIQMLEGDETAWMRLNYGGIGIVVSSLLRPCIAAAPGNVITAADFNAIEMRFSAWLTDCSMILGALNRNEDVYRMMAAKVFGYADWRDIGKDSFERMLGKKIILGCFEADTPVLTRRGWVPIVNVKATDTVWDGEEWQTCDGSIYRGKKMTVEYAGVRATPEHKTLVGKEWVRWSQVRGGNVRFQKKAHNTASLPSSMCSLGPGAGCPACMSDVAVPRRPTGSHTRTLLRAGRLGVTVARRGLRVQQERKGRALRTLCPMTNTGPGGSIGGTPFIRDVAGRGRRAIRGMVGAVFDSTRDGLISASSWPISALSPGGTTRYWNSTVGTTTAPMPSATSVWLRDQNSSRIPVGPVGSYTRVVNTVTRLLHGNAARVLPRLQSLAGFMKGKAPNSVSPTSTSREARVYDVLNAGPRSRFTILTENGPLVVHNCGYQMGWEKFWNSCRDEGIVIDQALAKEAVQTYRAENYEIKDAWKMLEWAGVEAVQTGRRVAALGGKVAFYMKGPDLKVVLPSGRELTYLRAYVKPEMKWGKEVPTVCFYGFNSERRRMEWQSMYGGRWMENITQAGSRDVLRDAIMRLDAQGWQIILSVHDEVIDESPLGRFTAEQMETEMARPPHWAPGLPLKVEGWQGPRYRK